MPSITNLGTTTDLSAKINKVKNKIPKITNLANATALTTFEIKICHVSSLVKKTDCNTNICEIEKKLLLIINMIKILLLNKLINKLPLVLVLK